MNCDYDILKLKEVIQPWYLHMWLSHFLFEKSLKNQQFTNEKKVRQDIVEKWVHQPRSSYIETIHSPYSMRWDQYVNEYGNFI